MNNRMSSTNGLILLVIVFFLLSCCCFGCVIFVYTQLGRNPATTDDLPVNEWSNFEDKLGTNSFLLGENLELKVQKRNDVEFEDYDNELFETNCRADKKEILCEYLWMDYDPSNGEKIRLNIITGTTESEIRDEYRSAGIYEVKSELITTYLNINGEKVTTNILSLLNSKDEIAQFIVCSDAMKFCGIAYPNGINTIDDYDKEEFWDALTVMLGKINFSNSNQSDIEKFKEMLTQVFFKTENELKSFFLSNKKIELPADWFAGISIDLPDNLDQPNGYCGNLKTDYPDGCKIVRAEFKDNKNFHFIFSAPRQYEMLRDSSSCFDSKMINIDFGSEKIDLTVTTKVECSSLAEEEGELIYVKGCRTDNICVWGSAEDLGTTIDFLNGVKISD